MQLLFKPRDGVYLGSGDLPFGKFEDTSLWQPITTNLEKGAEMFPDKAMFKVGDRDGAGVTIASAAAWRAARRTKARRRRIGPAGPVRRVVGGRGGAGRSSGGGRVEET